MTEYGDMGYVPDQNNASMDVGASERVLYQKDAEITDKLGVKYDVNLVRSTDSTPNVLDTPEGQKLLPEVLWLTMEFMQDFDETNIHARLAGCNGLDLVKAKNGEPVGFHAYKFREVMPEGYETPVKVMYTSFAATNRSYNGSRISELSRIPVIEIENPDIIAGSTNVPAIYRTNQNIADAKSMIMYPKNTDTPEEIVKLGRRVLDATLATPNPPEAPPLVADNLVRTRRERQADEHNVPFFENIVPIGPNQQVLYMLLKPDLNTRILEGKNKLSD